MRINSTKLLLLSFLLLTGFSVVHALGMEASVQFVGPPSTPFPLSGRPNVPPPNLNAGLGDFLNHSIPAGYGMINGKVIDDGTGSVLAGAHITIPELKMTTRSDANGRFSFGPIQVGTSPNAELDLTLEAQAPGYGKHTMVNVGVFSQDTATVLLTLKKGTAETRWFGLPNKLKNTQTPSLPSSFSAPADSIFSGPLTFSSSTTSPPPYIRVAILPLTSTGAPVSFTPIRRDAVDFTFYMKHVLGNEWGPSWNTESLKAGAMAVKNYGWWFVIHPKYANSDIDNSAASQLYNPYISYASTDAAVDTMSSTGWYQNGAIFESQYCAGSYGSSNPCGTNEMSQKGSWYYGDPPQSEQYDWILNHYYGSLSYFYYGPKPPLTYVATSTPTTITLNFSSASSSQYQIWKYVNSVWTHEYTGSQTNWQDTGLTNGATYYYAGYASSPDGTWWSGAYPNGGYISAVAGWAPSQPGPITDAFFTATNTIRVTATTTIPAVDTWAVEKYFTASGWTTIYDAMPATATASTNDINSTNAFPSPAYLDMTKWEGSANGDRAFVYVDTGLTQNTQYFYSVAYHTAAGWSAWSNNNGALGPFTDQSN